MVAFQVDARESPRFSKRVSDQRNAPPMCLKKLPLCLTKNATILTCAANITCNLIVEMSTHTLISLEPSIFTLVLFPTISLGKTRSSRIASWTAVKVRLKRKEIKDCKSILSQYNIHMHLLVMHRLGSITGLHILLLSII